MELLIVIIAVVLVAVIARPCVPHKAKYQRSGGTNTINSRKYTSRRSVHPRRIRRVLTRIETQWPTD